MPGDVELIDNRLVGLNPASETSTALCVRACVCVAVLDVSYVACYLALTRPDTHTQTSL